MNPDENNVPLESDRIGPQVGHAGPLDGLTSLDLELSGMQRTFDPVAFDEAVAQRGKAVRADVVDGVELPVDLEYRDLIPATVFSHSVDGEEGS